jgi:catechol-2,3-dioxygenase
MPTTGFAHYNLTAPRALLDDLRDFYCEVVGLAMGPRPPFKHYGHWLYLADHDVLHLSELTSGSFSPDQVHTTFNHVAFRAADREGMQAKLVKLGIAFHTDLIPGSGQYQIFFKDPAGNGVELNFASVDS